MPAARSKGTNGKQLPIGGGDQVCMMQQGRTELSEHSTALSSASSTRPMQTTANKQDLGKAEQVKQDQTRIGHIRTTKPQQYESCQITTDTNNETDKSKTNQSAEAEQTIIKTYQEHHIHKC